MAFQHVQDKETVIIEIRAGAGGSEASLFAQELARMYRNYASSKGWRVALLDELVFEISGEGVYEKLCFESGVHRVQRVPKTEKSGRIHTSTASVAVLAVTDCGQPFKAPISPKISPGPSRMLAPRGRSKSMLASNVNSPRFRWA